MIWSRTASWNLSSWYRTACGCLGLRVEVLLLYTNRPLLLANATWRMQQHGRCGAATEEANRIDARHQSPTQMQVCTVLQTRLDAEGLKHFEDGACHCRRQPVLDTKQKHAINAAKRQANLDAERLEHFEDGGVVVPRHGGVDALLDLAPRGLVGLRTKRLTKQHCVDCVSSSRYINLASMRCLISRLAASLACGRWKF